LEIEATNQNGLYDDEQLKVIHLPSLIQTLNFRKSIKIQEVLHLTGPLQYEASNLRVLEEHTNGRGWI
jgi:hypothetical protein